MDEAHIRQEIQKSMRSLGVWDYHPPDDTPVATPQQIQKILSLFKADKRMFSSVRNILQPPTWKRESVSLSRPDIYLLNPMHRTIVIEVKAMKPKVKVAPSIHPNEISDGQRQWLDNWVYVSGGEGYLAVGTLEQPRDLWITPWDEWVTMEHQLYENNPDFRISTTDLKEHNQMCWQGDGIWAPPQFHPLWMYVIEDGAPPKEWKKTVRSLRFSEKGK